MLMCVFCISFVYRCAVDLFLKNLLIDYIIINIFEMPEVPKKKSPEEKMSYVPKVETPPAKGAI